ncbi:MAG: hypothetical protein KDA29_05555 [Phycisphaerales bacterium]|nr:hypothetical protein [Phycisphaerales bacterium]
MIILIQHDDPHGKVYRDLVLGETHAIEPERSLLEGLIVPVPTPDAVVLGDDVGHRGASPDEDASSWLQSWSQLGWERFDQAFRDASETAGNSGTQLVIRPSSTGMLSDAVCTLNWCTRGAGQGAMLLLDPLGWVVPSMMRDIEDHLDRITELCEQMVAHGRVWGVFMRSVDWNADKSRLVPASVGAGAIDQGMLDEKLRPLIESARRCVLLDPSDIARIEPGPPIES